MSALKDANLHKEHRSRVRQKFIKTGLEGQPDHNILEFLLFYSIPRKDTNEIAHKLIKTFGSLNGVFDATYERLLEVEGIGESSALLLSSISSICRKYVEGTYGKKINLSEPEDARNYILSKYYGCKNEIFYLICLDANGNLINCCNLGEGSPDSVAIDKRAVLETAFRNSADTVILAHNHPGGIAAPSKEDLLMTGEFTSIFKKVGIRLADHIIVGGSDALSLAEVPKFSAYFL